MQRLKMNRKIKCYGNQLPLLFSWLALALFQFQGFAQADRNATTDSSKSITIHQEVAFKVSPEKVYAALLSSKQFSESTTKSGGPFSATSAKIDARVGGSFSVFDGHIFGIVLELVPNQRIVEAWRVVDWPAGIYSIARFELIAEGGGSKLIFDHTGFPAGLKEHLATGWQEHYWDALTKYFE